MIVSPALRKAAFLGGLLAAVGLLGDPLWRSLVTLGRAAWAPAGGPLAWPKLAAPLTAALVVGWSCAWGLALFNRALVRRVSARRRAPRPSAPMAGGGWALLAGGAVLVAWVWAHEWGVTARARPGATLAAWPTWAWRVAGLAWLGLTCAGIAQSAARNHRGDR